MCSVQNSSDVNFGRLASEIAEDDFIKNLFSHHHSSSYHNQCPEDTVIQTNNANYNVVPAKTSWIMPNQMDHDYEYTEPSTILSSTWEETTTFKNPASSVNMSKYFSTFDPSIELPLQHCLANQARNCVQSVGKRHQARINFVPTTTGNLKSVVRRKRKRTVFRTDQIEAMEEVFAKKPYITREDRMVLVKTLQISDKSIKVWFQNRRLKNKRNDEESFEDEDRKSPATQLDYVESEILERTDEFGYVTLDDRLTSLLVQVIDDCLHKTEKEISNERTNTVTTDVPMKKTKLKVESIPLYEPISPASIFDCAYEGNSLECQYPEQYDSLERLIDIESIIINEQQLCK